MHRGYLKLASLLGALTVALGAFGAHALKQKLSATEPEAINVFQTAVQYQMYHVFALLAVGILYQQFSSKLLKWAANCFLLGIMLFSGSLYAITTFKVYNEAVPRFIGPITPFGGLLFIVGWLLLFFALAKGSK